MRDLSWDIEVREFISVVFPRMEAERVETEGREEMSLSFEGESVTGLARQLLLMEIDWRLRQRERNR